uniref:BURP domain-containing protein n=1 Tax=Kalanchoe fedtschenkoi TaxID=63787 RepID=A0A7N0SVU5_KALFE
MQAVVSHGDASSPAELYWETKLPNTPMPKPIQDFLPEAVPLGRGAKLFHESGGMLKSRTFLYKNAATPEEIAASNSDIFFYEDQLKPGNKLRVRFSTTSRHVKFLPAKLTDTLPLSSKDLPQTLARLAITPTSAAAKEMSDTVEDCEAPKAYGDNDEKCVASLEEMIDFSIEKLGQHIQIMPSSVERNDKAVQEYTIEELGVRRFAGDRTVACHAKSFAYPTFICHASSTTRAYIVPLLGADGNKVTSLVACHADTVKWNPDNLAFKLLKEKPGNVTVCHFLPDR